VSEPPAVTAMPPFPKPAAGRPFVTLWRFNRAFMPRYAAGAVLALLFSLINLGFPLVVRGVVADLGTGTLTVRSVGFYFLLLLGVALFAGIARYYQRTLMIGASRQFEYVLRNAYFRHILDLSARFFNRMPTGDILARATSDVNQVRDFVGPGVMGTVDTLFLPFTLGLMIYLSPRLTLVALLPLPLLTVLVYLFIRFLNRQSRIVQELFSKVSNHVQENLAGARLVRAYAIEERESRKFREVCGDYKQANILLASVMSFAWPLIDLLVTLALLVIVYYGGMMVIRGTLALEDFTAFLIVTAMLAWPLVQFGWVLTLYQRGAVSMNRISEILAAVPEIGDGEWTRPEATVREGRIRFENVCFRYDKAVAREPGEPAAPWTLEDISFEVKAGETLAVVGPTGSGKTTLVALLCREYEPDAGTVSIDDRNVREYPVESLHAAIGCARQEGFVFSDTIAENIRLGRTGLGDEEITQACEIARLAPDLALMPAGMDTMLGERGINLSGGQRQRLTLARALARNPKILVLDDTLSSVDADTEQAILAGLRNVTASRTCIIISHRLSAVAHASRIIVLDGGRIVERGVHNELIRANGLYARMYTRQLIEERLEREQ